MNKTSPWLDLWHHFASAEAPHAVKLHAVSPVRIWDALLEGRLVPKGKDEAFCVPSLPNENRNKKHASHRNLFDFESPKKRLLYMESMKYLPHAKQVHFSHGFWYEEVNNPFQNQRLYLRWKHVSFSPNRGIFHNTSQYKRKNSRNEVV